MRSKCIFFLIISMTLFSQSSQAQIFRKPTKKQLTLQVDSLLKLTDSLQQVILIMEMPVNDTLMTEAEINEGGFDNPPVDLTFEFDSLTTEQRLSLYYHQNVLNQMPDPMTLENLDTASLRSDIPTRSI